MKKGKFILTALCLALACFGTAREASSAEKAHINSIGMEFMLIPAGSFMMGMSPDEEINRYKTPQHKVNISKAFYMGKYEVTQAQWEAVMGSNPSWVKGPDNPVEEVSWDDAQEFIRRLNAREGHNRYRLPTEAEWEYAARAGTDGVYFFGDDKKELAQYAWYKDNSGRTTSPVGQKPANAWGLHDVYGNVWEWVQDWSGDKHGTGSSETDPAGPSNGVYRVVRGGSWNDYAELCSSGCWSYGSPGNGMDNLGFRLVLSLE